MERGNFCDCHVHVVGPGELFPQLAARSYTAAPVTLQSLQSVAESCGVSRFVLVQPSFYGTDNACLLEALDRLGDRGRGVVVIDPDRASRGLFEEFERRGVRGVRVNLYSEAGKPGANQAGDYLRHVVSHVPRAGWHVEVIAPLAMLVAMSPILASAPMSIVIDHFGLPAGALPESQEGRGLLELAGLPHVWLKLSAPYRVAADPLATAPPGAWLYALLDVAADRCVWGSDWPHTPPQEERKGADTMPPYRRLEYQKLFKDFCNALPDEVMVEKILARNPERLFGFSQ